MGFQPAPLLWLKVRVGAEFVAVAGVGAAGAGGGGEGGVVGGLVAVVVGRAAAVQVVADGVQVGQSVEVDEVVVVAVVIPALGDAGQ